MGGIVVAEIELFLLEQSGAKKEVVSECPLLEQKNLDFWGLIFAQLKNPRRQIFTETDSDLKRNNSTKRRQRKRVTGGGNPENDRKVVFAEKN